MAVFLAAFLAAGVANYCLAEPDALENILADPPKSTQYGSDQKNPTATAFGGREHGLHLVTVCGVRDTFIWEFGGFRCRDFREKERERERERDGGGAAALAAPRCCPFARLPARAADGPTAAL